VSPAERPLRWAKRLLHAGAPTPKFTLACVVDAQPRFYPELVLWLTCVQRHLPPTLFRPVVYIADGVPDELTRWVTAKGVETRRFEPPIPTAPHCNKIVPFLDARGSDYVVVTDADVYFVGDISVFFRSRRIRAVPNSHNVPPPRIFRRVLEQAGYGRRYRPGLSLLPGPEGGRETFVANLNGGLIALPRAVMRAFAPIWLERARWLDARRALLESWSVHVDQVAFALATEDCGEEMEFLPAQASAIPQILPQLETVLAFHLSSAHAPQFPALFTPSHRLDVSTFAPAATTSVARLNAAIDLALAEIEALPAARAALPTFLNPNWRRP